ncbi:MAG: T9SS type A sorting domain-containing protein [Fimbriimonadaceae bacterium]|nr:T9SS type A sorting domain-containing protein [Chitinophagales bacterium]
MKSKLQKTRLLLLLSFSLFLQALNAQAPGMLLKEGVGEGAVIKQLSDGNMIGLFSDALIKMDPYGNNIWIADEYTNSWIYPSTYFLGDIFENTDGSFTAFSRNSIYRFASDGSLVSSTSFVDDTSLVAVCRVPSGYQMLLKYYAGTWDHYYLYRRIMDDGALLWSYELDYTNYAIKTDMFSSGENTQILIRMMDAGVMSGFRTILLDTMGTVLSDVSDDGIGYYGDVFNNGEDLLVTQLDGDYDEIILTKMDYTNETVWSYSNYPGSGDSTAKLLQLPSGNIITAFTAGPWLDEQYYLQYHSSEGDSLFTSAGFLDGQHYDISDILYDEANNALVFIGTKDYDEGFILITDTLGNYIHTNVEGRVYEDINTNGIYDDGEVTFHGIIISSPPYYDVTDDNGYYSLFLPNAGEYTITSAYPEYWDLMDPSAGYTVTVDEFTSGDTLTGYDYRMSYSEPITDLVISTHLSCWAYGYEVYGHAHMHNYGNQYAVGGTVTMHFPAGLNIIYSDPAYDTLEDTTVTWTFSGMDPYTHKSFSVNFDPDLDPDLIGDTTLTIAIAEPITGDYVPENNIDTFTRVITASWDPNHKLVSPMGETEEGNVSPETEWLQYTIEFQNTGTSEAINIFIYDTLDSDISFTTLQMLAASHNYTMDIISPNILKWTFANIFLPDSTTDFLGSNGFLQFRIKINEGSPVGTVIKNSAAIYFDFNSPVITNTTITTLKEAVVESVDDIKAGSIQLYPNPNDGTFTIDLPEMQNKENISITIKNISGEEIYTEQISTSEKQYIIQLSKKVANGTYIIELKAGKDIYLQQLVISK